MLHRRPEGKAPRGSEPGASQPLRGRCQPGRPLAAPTFRLRGLGREPASPARWKGLAPAEVGRPQTRHCAPCCPVLPLPHPLIFPISLGSASSSPIPIPFRTFPGILLFSGRASPFPLRLPGSPLSSFCTLDQHIPGAGILLRALEFPRGHAQHDFSTPPLPFRPLSQLRLMLRSSWNDLERRNFSPVK